MKVLKDFMSVLVEFHYILIVYLLFCLIISYVMKKLLNKLLNLI